MNILRDPPKSVQTRRIDKVGETSSITEMLDESGNRACEAISYYARGVNNMVSVSYGNQGNNGGQALNRMSANPSNQGKQAFLPYTVMKDGVFRPPVMRQEQLMPLSRQPRIWTEAFTNKAFPDFSKKMLTCGKAEDMRQVKNDLLKVCVRPNAVYKIERPVQETYDIKRNIQNPVFVSATSGIRTMDRTTQNVQKPTKEIDYNNLHADARTNLGSVRHVDNNNFDTNPYLQDTLHSDVRANGSRNIQATMIDDIMDLSDIRTKDTHHTDYTTPLSGYDKVDYIHDEREMRRTLPQHNASTNVGKNIYKRQEYENSIELDRNMPMAQAMSNVGTTQRGAMSAHMGTEYRLNEKVRPGGFDGRASMPMTDRMNTVAPAGDTEKSRMGRMVMEQFSGRYGPSVPAPA